MSMSIVDAEDAVLFAQAEAAQFKDEFLREWYGPIGRTMMAILVSRLTPEALAAMRESNPVAMDTLGALIAGGR